MNADKAKAEFLNVCGEILMGKAKKEDIERVTKNMIDTGQSAFVIQEFKDIQATLTNG